MYYEYLVILIIIFLHSKHVHKQFSQSLLPYTITDCCFWPSSQTKVTSKQRTVLQIIVTLVAH